MKTLSRFAVLPLALGLAPIGSALAADPFTIASYPLFLAPAVKPNLMVIFDNSESMDATMSGQVVSGNLPDTRGNIARSILRNVIATNRDNFNWGLTTFATATPGLYDIHAFYLGDATTMVYTNNCVNGVSSDNNKRCIPNPTAATNGMAFITYDRSGDDADINDVTYHAYNPPDVMYGVGAGGTTYAVYGTRTNGTDWTGFTNHQYTGSFSATDAGFVASATTYPRRLWIRRGKGYYANVTGLGDVKETVQADSTTHFNKLQSLLGEETLNTSTQEIKNAAVFTSLAGSVKTARDYFASGIAADKPSPVSQTCQANFVVLATDGNPTAKISGSPISYTAAERQIDFTPPNTYTFGTAQQHVFNQITGLRSTQLSAGYLSNSLNGQTFDIKTYVIGMGDSVTNDKSVATLNEMAKLGGAHPTAFLGASSTSLATAFEAIVSDIQAKTSTASAAAVNAGSWNAGSRVFQAKFNSVGWSGNVLAYAISSAGAITSTPSWEAAERIKLLEATQRKIVTFKPSGSGKGVAFRWPANEASPTVSEIDTSQVSALNKDAAGSNDGHGAARLAFLRGDASREPRNCPACAAPVFRNRVAGPLGDIVNSAPYFVANPSFNYPDDFESAAYSSFALTHAYRTPVVYVGANDGMLHAFNATTGDELLAYVPSTLYGDLSKLSGSSYNHRYYVDGSPMVGDVFYDNAWHTLLVSGMRAGGRGLFALDVTSPSTFSEANAASIVRWEFQDSELGHVYGQPLLVKTNNGRWSVIVGGGYKFSNNSGRAKLFVIDAETGALTRKIDTGSGSEDSPNGLSAPAAVDTNGDGIVDLVYAGDLNGNLWKFDLTSATPASWQLGNGLAPLFAAAGANQPITGVPDVTRSPKGGFLIGFGTGRYLTASDNTSTAIQRIYVIRDSLTDATVTLAQLQQQTVLETSTTADGAEFRLSSHAVGSPADLLIPTKDNLISRTSFLDTKKGWYLSLPTSGERVVTDATFRAGRFIVTSMIPDASTTCAAGGSGWLLEFDAITGNRLGTPTFDISGDDAFTSSDFLVFSGAVTEGRYNVSGVRIQGIPTGPAFVSSGKLDFRLIPNSNENDSNPNDPNENPETDPSMSQVPTGSLGSARDGRAMWREVR